MDSQPMVTAEDDPLTMLLVIVVMVFATVASARWLVARCRQQPASRIDAFARLLPPVVLFVVVDGYLGVAGKRYGGPTGSVVRAIANIAFAVIFFYAIWLTGRVRREMNRQR